jgi:small subunit ribosomal protein S1
VSNFLPGTIIEAMKVLSVAEYGVFVRVADGIEALVPNNDIPDGAHPSVGDTVRGEIANLDSVDRRVTVSLKNIGETSRDEQVQAVKREVEAMGRSSSAGTLGDLLKEKLGDKLQSLATGSASSDNESQ